MMMSLQKVVSKSLYFLRCMRHSFVGASKVHIPGSELELCARREGGQEAILRVAQRAMYDDPRVAGGPDVLSESARSVGGEKT